MTDVAPRPHSATVPSVSNGRALDLLADAGFSGYEAKAYLALLAAGEPMNGYEVAKRIRELEGARNVLLVALTGYGRPEDKMHSKQAGFDYHMTKPADFDSLERMLRVHGQEAPPLH